jgi:hypothetical protein
MLQNHSGGNLKIPKSNKFKFETWMSIENEYL